MATTLPLRAAAARLHVREDTLRKRLQHGRHPGRKRDGQWWVDVPDRLPDPVRDVPGPPGPVPDAPGPVPEAPSRPGPVPDPPGSSLAQQRAGEMAEYTERLLAPWRAVVQAQAERIGRLEAQLTAAETVRTSVQNGAAPGWPERRRWWQRLVWG